METKFKSSDDQLKQLVAERRQEVVRLQKSQAEQIEKANKSGQTRMDQLKKSLPQDVVTFLDNQEKTHKEEQAAIESYTAEAKTSLSSIEVSPENITSIHPGLVEGHLLSDSTNALALGWYSPYYATLHGSNGAVYWQGYNPGNFDLSDSANGSGSGLFGSGSASFTVYLDWWFTFKAPENRNYAHTIQVPFHGYYIIKADDGFWDSKEAKARIDLSAVGYQYNYKATGSSNVFDMGSQNINVNDRFDGYRTMYYSDLLGADQAYLRVTASFYVYARGGGSTAQLNFSDGNANYIGVPWVYIV
ncbi:hypothetical protein [Spirosoma flavum]|uniref:Uncharacterized protein n=1 Tax=Spirosoma flavum TaxID=2048557 RepID=A0ABW6AFP1_9BACT